MLLALGRVGDDAGEIDRVAVDDSLAHARTGIVALDLHGVSFRGLIFVGNSISRQRVGEQPCA